MAIIAYLLLEYMCICQFLNLFLLLNEIFRAINENPQLSKVTVASVVKYMELFIVNSKGSI